MISGKSRLRCGFSTGTAVAAAARAALRCWLTGRALDVVAVRLPSGCFLPVSLSECRIENGRVLAAVIKDGGDDPDVTHGAEIRVALECVAVNDGPRDAVVVPGGPMAGEPGVAPASGIRIVAGKGVGVVTKAGLAAPVGEPAVNPVPREMLSANLTEELLWWAGSKDLHERGLPVHPSSGERSRVGERPVPERPHVLIPFGSVDERLSGLLIAVEIEVPRGEEIARRTLNPRLGVLGGISILGTTGIVKPFSHKAYEETIQAALSVAASGRHTEVVLSTGGKSERFARELLSGYPVEVFVQIADFFAFAVREARRMGFKSVVHSAFFGKVVKMSAGNEYTHAHEVPLDLEPVARLAKGLGYDGDFCRRLAEANTARHAFDLLMERGATVVIRAVAQRAVEQSRRISGERLAVRLLLFDYDGVLLADLVIPGK